MLFGNSWIVAENPETKSTALFSDGEYIYSHPKLDGQKLGEYVYCNNFFHNLLKVLANCEAII